MMSTWILWIFWGMGFTDSLGNGHERENGIRNNSNIFFICKWVNFLRWVMLGAGKSGKANKDFGFRYIKSKIPISHPTQTCEVMFIYSYPEFGRDSKANGPYSINDTHFLSFNFVLQKNSWGDSYNEICGAP